MMKISRPTKQEYISSRIPLIYIEIRLRPLFLSFPIPTIVSLLPWVRVEVPCGYFGDPAN